MCLSPTHCPYGLYSRLHKSWHPVSFNFCGNSVPSQSRIASAPHSSSHLQCLWHYIQIGWYCYTTFFHCLFVSFILLYKPGLLLSVSDFCNLHLFLQPYLSIEYVLSKIIFNSLFALFFRNLARTNQIVILYKKCYRTILKGILFLTYNTLYCFYISKFFYAFSPIILNNLSYIFCRYRIPSIHILFNFFAYRHNHLP